MPLPVLTWRSEDSADPVASIIFADIQPNTPTDWQTLTLHNNYAAGPAVDVARNVRVLAWARLAGDTDWISEGLEVLDRRCIQMQVLGGTGNQPPGGVQPMGAGRRGTLPDIGDQEALTIRFRIYPPSAVELPNVQIAFEIQNTLAVPLVEGIRETVGGGIRLGIGDGEMSAVVAWAGATANSPADDKVDVTDLVAIAEGVPFAELLREDTFSALDGDGATLGTDEGYYALLVITSTGSLWVKGSKAPLPLVPETNDPAVPSGARAILRVLRTDDATIEQADITQLAEPEFAALAVDGLTVEVGACEAIVGDFFTRTTAKQQAEVATSSTTALWKLPDGTLELKTDGSRPDPDALQLGEFVSDGAAITASVDLRTFLDQLAHVVSFVFPAPAQNDEQYWRNPFSCAVYVRPIRGVRLAIDEAADTLANSAGAWVADVELLEIGTGWSTLFSSQATDDRRPTLNFDATTNEADNALPEVYRVLPGQLVRCSLPEAMPTGGTPAGVLVVTMTLEVPR